MKTRPKIEFITSCSGTHGTISQWYIPFKNGERKAICIYCKLESLTDERLPFFKVQPTKDNDSYFCGCRGFV